MALNKLTTIFLFLVLAPAYAGVDSYNTFQWNRKNYFLGNKKIEKTPWYEWWYYKLVLPTDDSFYAVYGVVNPWDTGGILQGTRAYVGFGNFSDNTVVDQQFPVRDFEADYHSPAVRVGNENSATDRHFEGKVTDPIFGMQRWSIDISQKWSFNAMGWAMHLPSLTNIAWYPAQADARCSGRIESSGKIFDFTDVPCYQDRNWGTSFPEWWAWIVSNQFNEEEATLVVGGGLPEVLGRKIYSGVSIGLKFRGHEYSFRPQDLNRVETEIRWGRWKVSAQNAKLRIEIEAEAPREKFMDLQFTTPTGEIFHDYETLTGRLTLKIFERGKWVTTLTSDRAGIEYGSKNQQRLQAEMYSY